MSMNCKKAEEYLVEYLYQELSAKKTLEIEKHLHGCAHCTKTIESWRGIHRGYQRSVEEPQLAPYFKQKILAAAEEELLRPPSWQDRLLFGLKIATIPVAIFLIVILFNQKQNPPNMAMKQRETAAAPATVSEPAPEGREQEPKSSMEGKRDLGTYTRKESYVLDKLKAAPAEKKAADYDQESAKSEADTPLNRPSTPERQDEQSFAGSASPEPAQMEQAQAPQKAAQISTVSKTNANELFLEGQKKLQNKDTQSGVDDLRKAISEGNPKELPSQFHQNGNLYQSKGDYANAIIQFRLLQTNYPDYQYMDNVLLRLGDSYSEIGQFDNAVKAYRQVSGGQQKVAQERIRQLQKKSEAQEQLKSLGYIDTNKQ